MRARVYQPHIQFPQPLRGHGHRIRASREMLRTSGNITILTENTMQRAAGEKDRARAARAGNNRLLSEMKRSTSHTRLGSLTAAADRLTAIRAAAPRT